jgi:hypothetical protein
MKKSILVFVFTLIIGISAVFAQKNVIKVNLFSPVVLTGSFFYERALNEKSSAILGLAYTGIKIKSGSSETKISGLTITPEYRFYLGDDEAPRGFYVGPFLRFRTFKLTESSSSSEGSMNIFGGGVIVGKQWLFNDRISPSKAD